MLPIYQTQYQMYDRFVPYLGMLADKKRKDSPLSWILDIGANVGDTAVALIKHTDAKVLCIESDKYFFTILRRNLKNLGKKYENRFKYINAFASSNNDDSYVSVKSSGTAHMEKSSTSDVPTFTIPDLLSREKISLNDVVLIKTDTAGHDFECIEPLASYLDLVPPHFLL